MKPTEVLCAIPARYKSSRFPGKPLALIHGVPMVVRVAQAAMAATPWVVVATEDARIVHVCRQHGIEAALTKDHHPTGTDRVAELAARLEAPYIVNIQGDEPLLPSGHIRRFIDASIKSSAAVTNAMARLSPTANPADITIPKVVVTPDLRLVYISRSIVPNSEKGAKADLFRQIGLYGFTREALQAYGGLGHRGSIEQSEDIEILRFFDLGIPVHMTELADYGPAVDLPLHVPLVERMLGTRGQV